MKTVVAGASGHVGVNLVRALLAKGREVRVLSHNTNLGLDDLPIELCKGDVCHIESLADAFKDADVVFHLAARVSLLMNDWKCCSTVNVEGTRNVVETCLRAKVRRLVHFSSTHALYPESKTLTIDESCELVESSKRPPYDLSKAGGEKVVRKAIKEGLDAIIIHPTAVIGPYDYRPSHQGQALILMASGRLPVLLDGGFDWVDVRDVAEYSIRAQEIAPAGSTFLLSGHWLSVRELSQMVAGITGKWAPGIVCPMPVARAYATTTTAILKLFGARPIITPVSLDALISNPNISHDKASRELGYNPRPIEQTVTDTVRWFVENGYLQNK